MFDQYIEPCTQPISNRINASNIMKINAIMVKLFENYCNVIGAKIILNIIYIYIYIYRERDFILCTFG